jgi:hypothetical protein
MIKIRLIILIAGLQIASQACALEFENPFKPKDEMKELLKKDPKAYHERQENFNWEKISDNLMVDKNSYQTTSYGISSIRTRLFSRKNAKEYPHTYEYTVIGHTFDCEKYEARVYEVYILTKNGPKWIEGLERGSPWGQIKRGMNAHATEAFEYVCRKKLPK